MTFKCQICSSTKTLLSTTTVVRGDKIVVKEAVCCDQYMTHLAENNGVPTIIRNERNGR